MIVTVTNPKLTASGRRLSYGESRYLDDDV
jgi:hypothetical protein